MTTLTTAAKESIKLAVASNEEFPFDLRESYEWFGYTRFDSCVDAFLNCGFEENIDYKIEVRSSPGIRNGRDYKLSRDCFKHFAMQLKTATGKAVRSYYIECEKLLEESRKKPLSSMQMIAAIATELHEQSLRLEATEAKVERLDAMAPKADYFTQLGYLNTHGIQWKPEMKGHWRLLKKMSELEGLPVNKIPDAKYGSVNTYHVSVLDEFYQV